MHLGLTELIFIFGIILIVFGPTKLPTLESKVWQELLKNFKMDLIKLVKMKTNETK